MEENQYIDQNIWDMSIGITYFVLDILQVDISRLTYYEGHPINRENFLIMQEFVPLEHGICNR